MSLIEGELSRDIVGAFYEVNNSLGFGFLESAYRRAMAVELHFRGISVAQEVPFELTHRGVQIGHYRADLIVERRIVVETKTGRNYDPFAESQVINYLKATGLKLGIILHFGTKATFKRIAGPAALGTDQQ